MATVRTDDAFLVPRGYHGPCMASPEHALWYLNVLAGPGAVRSMAISDDPAHAAIRGAWAGQETDPRVPLATAEGEAGVSAWEHLSTADALRRARALDQLAGPDGVIVGAAADHRDALRPVLELRGLHLDDAGIGALKARDRPRPRAARDDAAPRRRAPHAVGGRRGCPARHDGARRAAREPGLRRRRDGARDDDDARLVTARGAPRRRGRVQAAAPVPRGRARAGGAPGGRGRALRRRLPGRRHGARAGADRLPAGRRGARRGALRRARRGGRRAARDDGPASSSSSTRAPRRPARRSTRPARHGRRGCCSAAAPRRTSCSPRSRRPARPARAASSSAARSGRTRSSRTRRPETRRSRRARCRASRASRPPPALRRSRGARVGALPQPPVDPFGVA